MQILVLNCGSSSLKFQVIEISGASERKLARGIVDRIGANANYRFEGDGFARVEASAQVHDHEAAVRLIIERLSGMARLRDIDAVGHRVVHGGDRFTSPALIDEAVITELDALCDIAPLHNPGALAGIRAANKILGAAVPMVAAFDTSFHHTMPESASTYAIPYDLAQKHKIRRYGFHGLAHEYDIGRYAELCGKSAAQVSVVTLHLGNGCSATAIRHGRSVDTSMGFTPLEGLVMGTRSGDLDPALINYLARKENAGGAEVETWLNQRSGLLGLSGVSNDMRELTAAYDSNPRARLAVDVFCHRARKYLGAYLAVIDGAAEAVIFSGGIGENSTLVRKKILTGMEWCGLSLDPVANENVTGRDGKISALKSKLDVFVIHTEEEVIIARETAKLVQEASQALGSTR
jgi:acetate kinase